MPSPGSMRRRVRARAVRLVRSSPLLPSTWPDRIGDEDRIGASGLPQPLVVYFPDTRDKLYQLRQWYSALGALAAASPVVVIGQDSRAMAAVRAESGLTAVTIARYDAMAALVARSAFQAVLYVNHSPQNFSMLRFPSLAHVYLSHGDSDKGVSVSNQIKAYDFCFVAGQAAIDRMAQHLMFTDIRGRCIAVGRPELDDTSWDRRQGPGGHPRVLYAPTWEGAQASMAYGSVTTHGRPAVEALVESGRFAVTYRPHPLSGRSDPAYAAADAGLRAYLTQAQQRDPTAGHRIDTGPSMPAAFAEADLLLCDVSSVAMDWLPTQRPLIVTVPAAGVATARTRLLDVVPRLTAADSANVVALVEQYLNDDPGLAQRRALVDYYLGDTSPGAATQRFLAACRQVLQARESAWAAVSSDGGDPARS